MVGHTAYTKATYNNGDDYLHPGTIIEMTARSGGRTDNSPLMIIGSPQLHLIVRPVLTGKERAGGVVQAIQIALSR